MTFVHGKDSAVYMAEFDLSAFLTAVDASIDVATHESFPALEQGAVHSEDHHQSSRQQTNKYLRQT